MTEGLSAQISDVVKSSGNGALGILAIVGALFFCPCDLSITFPVMVALSA